MTSQGKRAIADNLTERRRPARPAVLLDRPGARDRRCRARHRRGALAGDKVSITPIYLDLTNVPVLSALKKVFE